MPGSGFAGEGERDSEGYLWPLDGRRVMNVSGTPVDEEIEKRLGTGRTEAAVVGGPIDHGEAIKAS